MKRLSFFCTLSLIVGLMGVSSSFAQLQQADFDFPSEATVTPKSIENGPLFAPPKAAAGILVNSIASGDWNAPGTWDCGCVPSSLHDVTILASHEVTLNLDAEVLSIVIDPDGSLTFDGDTDRELTVYGDMDINGGLSTAEGSIRFAGTDTQTFTGAMTCDELVFEVAHEVHLLGQVNVVGLVSLDAATVYANGNLRLSSASGASAKIGTIESGSIVGDVQIESTLTAGNTGWLSLAAPFTDATLEEWNDDFITTGFQGSDYPAYNFYSIRTYDESKSPEENSFVGVDSVTQVIQSNLGYYVYVNAGSYTFDSQGEPVQGNMTFPVNYTDHDDLLDGMNLLGNPYPCDINWESETGWSKENLYGAIYVWDVSLNQFRTYSNGFGVNGGSPLIKACETFWVQAAGPDPSLEINETAKVTSWEVQTNTTDDYIQLAFSGLGQADELVVAFDEMATSNFDPARDAFKFISGSSLNVYTLSDDSTQLAINSCPLNEGDFAIPVVTKIGSASNFEVEVTNLPELEPGVCFTLEDLVTGEIFALEEGGTIPFDSEAVDETRFMLHIGQPIAVAKADVSCFGTMDASITMTGIGDGPFDYTWYDAEDNVIFTETGVTGSSTMTDLAPGTYTVSVDNNTCGTLTRSAEVTEPTELVYTESLTHLQCDEVNTGIIDMEVSGGTEPYTINWENGLTGPDLSGLAGGTYNALLTDANGCMENVSYELDAAPTVVAFFQTETQIINLEDGEATISFTSECENADTYVWDFGDESPESNEVNPSHTYTEPGFYVVSLTASNDECSNNYQIVVTVQVGAGIQMNKSDDDIIVLTSDGQIFVEFANAFASNYRIEVYNMLGQRLMNTLEGSYGSQRIGLDLDYAATVLMIEVHNLDSDERHSFKVIQP